MMGYYRITEADLAEMEDQCRENIGICLSVEHEAVTRMLPYYVAQRDVIERCYEEVHEYGDLSESTLVKLHDKARQGVAEAQRAGSDLAAFAQEGALWAVESVRQRCVEAENALVASSSWQPRRMAMAR